MNVFSKKGEGYILDKELIRKIQPRFNMIPTESFMKKGNSYEACLHVSAYPESDPGMFWLEMLTSIDDAIVTIDGTNYDDDEARNDLERAMSEDTSNYNDSISALDQIDSETSYSSLNHLYRLMRIDKETLKLIHTRIYVADRTLASLQDKVFRIVSDLEAKGFRLGIYLNEVVFEYKALLMPATWQKELPNRRFGQPIPPISLAYGYPFNYTSHIDPYGDYIGYVPNGGSVVFDLFHHDKINHTTGNIIRLSYDAILMGMKGAGKSTLLKKLSLSRTIRNDYIRGIAVSNEFDHFCEQVGGKMLSMDGSNGIINLLDVVKTSEDEATNFSTHLSKLSTVYRYLSPTAPDTEVNEFEALCRELYVIKGLWTPAGERAITGLAPETYPTFSDLLAFVKGELYEIPEERQIRENITSGRISRLEAIILVIENLVENAGNIFDGHTSFPNIENEQVVFYDIRHLTNMKREYFNVQIFNILSGFWSIMLAKGLEQKTLHETGKVSFEDVSRLLLVVDEAHYLINSGNMQVLKFLENFLRETRKYFTSLVMATQNARDIVPESNSSEFVDEIKKLFELCQYKFIMRQDGSSMSLLKSIFGTVLTDSEIAAVPKFVQGETILSDGINNIRFLVDINDEEKDLYRGGV